MQIYSIANLNDVSWGTRQGKKDEKADNRSFFQRLLGKSPDEEDEEDWSGGEGGSCSCIFCPKIWRPKEEPPPPEPPGGTRRRTTKPSQKPSPSLQSKQPTRPPSISSQAGIHGPAGPGTDRPDLVRDFLNFVGPGPAGSGPWIPDLRNK